MGHSLAHAPPFYRSSSFGEAFSSIFAVLAKHTRSYCDLAAPGQLKCCNFCGCVFPKTTVTSNPNLVSPRGTERLKKSARFMKAALEISANKGKFWQVALQSITSF